MRIHPLKHRRALVGLETPENEPPITNSDSRTLDGVFLYVNPTALIVQPQFHRMSRTNVAPFPRESSNSEPQKAVESPKEKSILNPKL